MRSSLWLLLGLFSATGLSACGGAGSSPAAGGGTSAGRAAPSSGAQSPDEAVAGESSIAKAGEGDGGASDSSSSFGAITWNSAKSVSLSDDALLDEYDAWKSANVNACSNGSSVVMSNGSVTSAGIGYGMLLAVGVADQTLFDGLWKYYQDHLDKNGLMNDLTRACGTNDASNVGATSGADLDATMALLQAESRWPKTDYLEQARGLAAKIAQFETEVCSGRRVLRPSDVLGGCSDATNSRINPSYFTPGYYKVFAHYFAEQATTWNELVDGSYQLYAIYQARMDNLVPDWSGPDGSDNGTAYGSEACRTPFRVATDYAWTGDTRAKVFMQNVAGWVDRHGGLPNAAQEQNSAFVGAFALSGGYDQAKLDRYVSAWLGARLDDGSYYAGTLRVLYLLVAAGKFSSTL